MCGLGGIIWKSGVTPAHAGKWLDLMEGRLEHRGPDESGRLIGEGFAVVHRRLAIVDIADGHQPMLSSSDRVGVVYNGEIYNHELLRDELQRQGKSFRTRCDTETLLEAYIEHGASSFVRHNGMFAALIWDFRQEPVFHLFRDHMGTKPLYIYEDEHIFAFASEIRAILALPGLDLNLDRAGLQRYLCYRYTPDENTLFARIKRVEAGCAWTIKRQGALRWRFWDLPKTERHTDISEPEAAEQLYALLRDSVKSQMMGEVPIGLTLSGGIDSSVIACLCDTLGAHYKSFNIGFPDVNEFEYSKDVAKKFGQHHIILETTVDEIVRNFEEVVWAMDEPIADPACFPLHVLCKEIKKHVTVVLSGEGSDELLGGYPQYGHVLNGDPIPQAQQFSRFMEQSWYFTDDNTLFVGGADPARLRTKASYFNEHDLLDGMLRFDLKTWLPENLLMKADKILMSHSLEGRFPFLDIAFVEFVSSLSPDLKYRRGVGKYLLRQVFEKQLPKSVVERPKMGFSVPVDQLVLKLHDRIYDLIGAAEGSGFAEIVDLEHVREMADLHFDGTRPNALEVWTVLVLLQWYSLAGLTKRRAATPPSTRGAEPRIKRRRVAIA